MKRRIALLSAALFAFACASGEILSKVELTLTQGSTAYMTVTLTNAIVSRYTVKGQYEEIAFTYQKIEWKWLNPAVSASSDWQWPAT